MEKVRERLDEAESALSGLKQLVALAEPSVVERDAALARFNYTFEAVWKTARHYLLLHEGVDAASPKGCIRASRRVGLLSDEQAEGALVMTNDRNLIVHTYKEKLATEIFRRATRHAEVLEAWLNAMRTHVEET